MRCCPYHVDSTFDNLSLEHLGKLCSVTGYPLRTGETPVAHGSFSICQCHPTGLRRFSPSSHRVDGDQKARKKSGHFFLYLSPDPIFIQGERMIPRGKTSTMSNPSTWFNVRRRHKVSGEKIDSAAARRLGVFIILVTCIASSLAPIVHADDYSRELKHLEEQSVIVVGKRKGVRTLCCPLNNIERLHLNNAHS